VIGGLSLATKVMRDRDIGAVARGAQRHRKANAPRGAGDEEASCP